MLDEQPILAIVARFSAHSHKGPAAMQLFTVERELKFALFEAFVRVDLRFPCSVVPYHDCAATIFTLWYDTLERRVVDRVVFNLHGQRLHHRIETWALWHSP